MGLIDAGAAAKFDRDRHVGDYEPHYDSHDALDKGKAVQERPPGTSPEQILGAAHDARFTMAFSLAPLETLQLDVGCRRKRSCVHCRGAASPQRIEMMDGDAIALVIEAPSTRGVGTPDPTGGGARAFRPMGPRAATPMRPTWTAPCSGPPMTPSMLSAMQVERPAGGFARASASRAPWRGRGAR